MILTATKLKLWEVAAFAENWRIDHGEARGHDDQNTEGEARRSHPHWEEDCPPHQCGL